MADGDAGRQVAVSVVVPVRNAASTIGEQLEALAEQDYRGGWEVLVVDNGSTDGTLDVARGFADRLPALRVVGADGRVGSSHARNVAMAAARADVVAFCDADDRVDRGWLRALTAAADGAGVVGGRLDYDLLNDSETRARRPEPAMSELDMCPKPFAQSLPSGGR